MKQSRKHRTYIQIRIRMRINLAHQDPDPYWGFNGAWSNRQQLQPRQNQDNPETLKLPRKFWNMLTKCFLLNKMLKQCCWSGPARIPYVSIRIRERMLKLPNNCDTSSVFNTSSKTMFWTRKYFLRTRNRGSENPNYGSGSRRTINYRSAGSE